MTPTTWDSDFGFDDLRLDGCLCPSHWSGWVPLGLLDGSSAVTTCYLSWTKIDQLIAKKLHRGAVVGRVGPFWHLSKNGGAVMKSVQDMMSTVIYVPPNVYLKLTAGIDVFKLLFMSWLVLSFKNSGASRSCQGVKLFAGTLGSLPKWTPTSQHLHILYLGCSWLCSLTNSYLESRKYPAIKTIDIHQLECLLNQGANKNIRTINEPTQSSTPWNLVR